MKFNIIIFLLLTVGLFAQENERRDGNWWRTISNFDLKFIYLKGVIDGTELGQDMILGGQENYSNDKNEVKFRLRITTGYKKYNDKYLLNVSYGQIIDGLDTLYADFKNRKISIYIGIELVTKLISGMSSELYNKYLELDREYSN
jgi:hypothetical protein